MKKLAFLLVICLAFCGVGCQKNELKQSENNYDQSEDKSEFGSIKSKNNSNQEKKKIDISSVEEIISLVLYDMYQN